jgi:hypothetical protein
MLSLAVNISYGRHRCALDFERPTAKQLPSFALHHFVVNAESS